MFKLTNIAWLTANGMTGSIQLRGNEAAAGYDAAYEYLRRKVAEALRSRHIDPLVSAVICTNEDKVTRVFLVNSESGALNLMVEQ